MANNGIVSVVREHKDEVLEMIAAGKPLTEIARHLGLKTPQAIVHRLADDPDYQDAMQSSAWVKLQTRETQLESADSNVTVTRADRLLGHARWFAERVARRWFAPAMALTGADGGPIQVQIVKFAGRIVEGESTRQNAALLDPEKGLNAPVDPPSVKQ